MTNDFNLNKVAQLRGVEVLNINELANALKPVVLPGEQMNVFILKEGKEPNQGVAYLDDGTMVVVDNARSRIGRNIDIVVTSVLQTTAGRMIFGRSPRTPRDRRRPSGGGPDDRAAPDDAAAPPPHKREPAAAHWWRTVLFLIPVNGINTIVCGVMSLVWLGSIATATCRTVWRSSGRG